MAVVSKDGNSFFDIDDSPDEIAKAKAKGYSEYLDVTKNGKDSFTILKDEFPKAQAKGYDMLESFATRAADQKYEYDNRLDNKAGKFLSSANAAFQEFKPFGGVSDRLEAAGGALIEEGKDLFGKGDGRSLRENYDQEFKENKEQRQKDLGKSAAGRATGAALGVGANFAIPGTGAKPGFVLGGIEGATTGDDLSFWGGVGGAALGGGIPAVAQAASDYLPTAWKAFKRSDGDLAGMKGVGVIDRISDAATAVFSQAKNSSEIKKFVRDIQGDTLSRMVKEGTSTEQIKQAKSMMENMDDLDYIQLQLAEKNPQVWDFVSKKAATLSPTNMQAEDYKRLGVLGMEERNAAKSLNRKDAARELTSAVKEGGEAFDQEIAAGVGRNTGIARNSFDGSMKDIRESLKTALEDSESMKIIPANIKKRLEVVDDMLLHGKAPSGYGLTQDEYYYYAANPERFNRIQKMRETLDQGIDWAAIRDGKRGMNEGEVILAGLRDKVDEVLKSVPGKAEADQIARRGFDLGDRVFSKTEFKQGVDEFKLARLLNSTDDAGRFRQALGELKEWAQDESLDPKSQKSVGKMIDQFESVLKRSDNARDLANFKYEDGPSSAAIKGLQSALKGQDRLQDAFLAPSGYLNNLDSFTKNMEAHVGKAWKSFDDREKRAAMKVFNWEKSQVNKGYTPNAGDTEKSFDYFLQNTK